MYWTTSTGKKTVNLEALLGGITKPGVPLKAQSVFFDHMNYRLIQSFIFEYYIFYTSQQLQSSKQTHKLRFCELYYRAKTATSKCLESWKWWPETDYLDEPHRSSSEQRLAYRYTSLACKWWALCNLLCFFRMRFQALLIIKHHFQAQTLVWDSNIKQQTKSLSTETPKVWSLHLLRGNETFLRRSRVMSSEIMTIQLWRSFAIVQTKSNHCCVRFEQWAAFWHLWKLLRGWLFPEYIMRQKRRAKKACVTFLFSNSTSAHFQTWPCLRFNVCLY